MRKIMIRLQVEYGGDWENRTPEWVAEQVEKVVDNNCGGYAAAYVLDVDERNEDDE